MAGPASTDGSVPAPVLVSVTGGWSAVFSLLFINALDGMRTYMPRMRSVSRLLSMSESLKKTFRSFRACWFCLRCPGCVTGVIEQEFLLGHYVQLCLLDRAADSYIIA